MESEIEKKSGIDQKKAPTPELGSRETRTFLTKANDGRANLSKVPAGKHNPITHTSSRLMAYRHKNIFSAGRILIILQIYLQYIME